MRKIWLVTTEHLEEELWFREEGDFKVAMNFVAIQAACNPDVVVLAFILMSNHVHLVLKGCREDAEQFVRQFKHRYSIYFSNKWGIKKFLKRNGVDIREIPYDDEAPERAIAYVQMNCVAANICSHPSQYPWGTGGLFFSQNQLSGTYLSSMSARERERLLHTNCSNLPNWRITQDGYIAPQEYVDVKAVEAIYRNAKRLNYFLNTSSKARRRLESDEHIPAFRDQVILSSIPDLCHSLFQKDYHTLSIQEKKEIMRQIRFRFCADVSQIARVCGFSYADAARLLDSI